MPTGTRLTTPLPRDYLTDPRLNVLRDPLAREAYLRAKLITDNLGRLPGDPSTLAGLLYPSAPPSRVVMQKIISSWKRAGLAFHYQNSRIWYLEISDTYRTQRIVGNMSRNSDFPPPPSGMISSWEQKFGLKRAPIRRKSGKSRSNDGDTECERGTDGVSLSKVKLSQVEKGREGLGKADNSDPNLPAGDGKDLTSDPWAYLGITRQKVPSQFLEDENNRYTFEAYLKWFWRDYREQAQQKGFEPSPADFAEYALTRCQEQEQEYPPVLLLRRKQLDTESVADDSHVPQLEDVRPTRR